MESALSDLKKICDEVKDTLDPVILSSIESLIDKTYHALSDENEDARNLLEETLMRGVELVQKSKIGHGSIGLDFPDVELTVDVDDQSSTEEESGSEIADEEERCDSSATTDEYEDNVGTSVMLEDDEVHRQIRLTEDDFDLMGQVGEEHSYSLKSPGPNPRLPLPVDSPVLLGDSNHSASSVSSRSLDRMEESSKVISNTKVRKVLKSVNWSNPFVHRVSTATSTGLPKYMFTPRSGQIKSGVYKASTTTAVKPTYSKSKPNKSVLTPCSPPSAAAGTSEFSADPQDEVLPCPPSPPARAPCPPCPPPQKTDASTGTEPAGLPPVSSSTAGPVVDPPNTVVTKYSHQWTLSHFSKKMKMAVGKSIDSMFFSIIVQGKKTDWSLMLYPNGDKEKVTGYVSLYLTCRNRKGLSMSLEFKFTILDQNGKSATAPTKSGSITAQMLSSNSSWGWESFVKQDELTGHSLLSNDRLTIMCDITLKCCDLELKPSMKPVAVDNRDIDQLVDFVGEIALEDTASKGKKKSKKNKSKRIVKDPEDVEDIPQERVVVTPENHVDNRCKEDVEVERLCQPEEKVCQDGSGGEVFQVVTRRKSRKNSERSSVNSKAESPQGKQRGFSKKTTPPRPSPSKPRTERTSRTPQRVLPAQVETVPVPGPDPPAPAVLKPAEIAMPSLRIDTKESLEALLSTKTLLEENISRLTEMVENKSTTISKISRDKVVKLQNISSSQETLQSRKSELEKRKVEAEQIISQVEEEMGEVDMQLRRAGEKAARLTMFLDMNLADAQSELCRLGEEKENLNRRLDMVEDKLRGNRQKERLLNIHNQIQRLQTNLECPICLKTAANPIFQCREGHLICSPCVTKVAQCAMCRQEGPVSIRNRYAENDSAELSRLVAERQEIMKDLTGE